MFRAIKFYWRFSKIFKANNLFCRIIKLCLFISLLTEFLLFLLPAQRDRRSPQRRFFANRYRGKYKYQLDFELSWHTYNSLNPILCVGGGEGRTDPPLALSAVILWWMHQPIPNFLTFPNTIPRKAQI